MESVSFVDAYKVLTYHESKIGDALKLLRNKPRLVAEVLLHAEGQGQEELLRVASAVMSGVYGNVIMQEDEALVLQVSLRS